jgi:hypothetical protein
MTSSTARSKQTLLGQSPAPGSGNLADETIDMQAVEQAGDPGETLLRGLVRIPLKLTGCSG